MSDAKNCCMIAEFEDAVHLAPDVNMQYIKVGNDWLPDYPHDLNATMRAARTLPADVMLVVTSQGGVSIKGYFMPSNGADPARAAFEALAAYLSERK